MGNRMWKHTRCKFLALPQTADVFPLCSCGSVRHCYYTNTYLGPRNLGSGQSQVTYRHRTSSTRDNTKMSQTANLKGKILNVPYPHIWFKIPEVGYKLKLGFFNFIFLSTHVWLQGTSKDEDYKYTCEKNKEWTPYNSNLHMQGIKVGQWVTPPTIEIFFKAFSQLEQWSVVSTCVLYEI